LRQDNADERLTPKAFNLGLVSEDRYNRLVNKLMWKNKVELLCRNFIVKPSLIIDLLVSKDSAPLKQNTKLDALVRRPQLSIFDFFEFIIPLKELFYGMDSSLRHEVFQAAEITLKYSGYIERESVVADKLIRLENIRITDKFEYQKIDSLSTEARQKLIRINPKTIGQASRIPGVSPSDINVLLVLLGR